MERSVAGLLLVGGVSWLVAASETVRGDGWTCAADATTEDEQLSAGGAAGPVGFLAALGNEPGSAAGQYGSQIEGYINDTPATDSKEAFNEVAVAWDYSGAPHEDSFTRVTISSFGVGDGLSVIDMGPDPNTSADDGYLVSHYKQEAENPDCDPANLSQVQDDTHDSYDETLVDSDSFDFVGNSAVSQWEGILQEERNSVSGSIDVYSQADVSGELVSISENIQQDIGVVVMQPYEL